MKLVVGLGNPGKKYNRTRHNVGWRVVDAIVKARGEKFLYIKESNSYVVKIGDVLYIKPQTFMNESGQAVRTAMDYYKVLLTDVLVVHDDKDLPFGTIRLRVGGSSAGHNGVQSVIQYIGEQFTRVRIGVANSKMRQFEDTADFVLAKFLRNEEARMDVVVDAAIAAVNDVVMRGLSVKNHRDITA